MSVTLTWTDENMKHKIMEEKQLEQKLVQTVKKNNGLCLKFISPGMDGMPDRILLFCRGRISFVEVKRPGAKPRALQALRHDALRKLGFRVFVLDDEEQIEAIIEETKGVK